MKLEHPIKAFNVIKFVIMICENNLNINLNEIWGAFKLNKSLLILYETLIDCFAYSSCSDVLGIFCTKNGT